MSLKKTVFNFLIPLTFLCLLSGCWDKKELEERAYVIGLGLDKGPDERSIEITFLIANPEVGSQQSGGSGSSEPAQEVVTIRANDIISARNTANAMVARELTYDLLRVFVVSEELAMDKDFLRYIYDATKDREIRKDAHLIISKEDAKVSFDKNKPKLETRPHKYYQFMINRGIETGLIPDSDLNRFFRVTENDAELFLAIYATTQLEEQQKGNEDEYLAGEINAEGTANHTQFMGAAVFKEGKMIGKVNGQETRVSVILDETSDISDVLTTYPDPFSDKYRLAARLIKKEKNDVKLDLSQGPPHITVKIPLTIEVLSDPSMVSYGEDEEKKKILKKHLEEHLSKMTEQVVIKMKEEFKGEPFMWSVYARKKFRTDQEYRKYDWMKSYQNAKVDVAVQVKFGEFGKQAKVPNLEELRD